jgi:hypothetical protein
MARKSPVPSAGIAITTSEPGTGKFPAGAIDSTGAGAAEPVEAGGALPTAGDGDVLIELHAASTRQSASPPIRFVPAKPRPASQVLGAIRCPPPGSPCGTRGSQPSRSRYFYYYGKSTDATGRRCSVNSVVCLMDLLRQRDRRQCVAELSGSIAPAHVAMTSLVSAASARLHRLARTAALWSPSKRGRTCP